MKNINTLVLSFLLVVIIFGSCTTVDHEIELLPLNDSIPTSASSSVIVNGKIYDSEDYSIVKVFNFNIETKKPIKSNGKHNIDLNDELESIMKKSGADAITDFSFRLLSVDKTSVALVTWGEILGSFGLAFAAGGLFPMPWTPEIPVPVIATSASIGILGIAESIFFYNKGNVVYEYSVRGNAVSIGTE